MRQLKKFEPLIPYVVVGGLAVVLWPILKPFLSLSGTALGLINNTVTSVGGGLNQLSDGLAGTTSSSTAYEIARNNWFWNTTWHPIDFFNEGFWEDSDILREYNLNPNNPVFIR